MTPARRHLYLLGGPARVGKSAIARELGRRFGLPWLSTDIIRSVLRVALPQLDDLDRGLVSGTVLADFMAPFLVKMATVCLAQAPAFLIEGVEWLPVTVASVASQVDGEVTACFLGRVDYRPADLAGYWGDNPWHLRLPTAELDSMPERIGQWSTELRLQCAEAQMPYVDTGDMSPAQVLDAVGRHLGIADQ